MLQIITKPSLFFLFPCVIYTFRVQPVHILRVYIVGFFGVLDEVNKDPCLYLVTKGEHRGQCVSKVQSVRVIYDICIRLHTCKCVEALRMCFGSGERFSPLDYYFLKGMNAS